MHGSDPGHRFASQLSFLNGGARTISLPATSNHQPYFFGGDAVGLATSQPLSDTGCLLPFVREEGNNRCRTVANNAEIDTIWEEAQEKLEPLRAEINAMRGRDGSDPDLPPFEEWTMPREPGAPWPDAAAKALEKARNESASPATRTKWLNAVNEVMERDYTLDTLPEHPVDPWNDPECEKLHAEWWKLRIERQQEIDASIAAKADTEYLYDQPYEDKSRVRVAGPFTVESLSPHRVPAVDVDDSLFDEIEAAEGRAKKGESGERADFAEMVLENLKRSGVQQRAKDDRLVFETMKLWPGEFIVAEGTVRQKSLTEVEDEEASEAGDTRRAAIFVGPEYGTVSRPALTAAAREAMDAGFDLLIAAAFNFDALAGELTKMGPSAQPRGVDTCRIHLRANRGSCPVQLGPTSPNRFHGASKV